VLTPCAYLGLKTIFYCASTIDIYSLRILIVAVWGILLLKFRCCLFH